MKHFLWSVPGVNKAGFIVLFLSAIPPWNTLSASEVKVATAASLTSTMPKLANRFEESSGHKVMITFGSSGTLMRQIAHGAPYELFLSADESAVLRLNELGKTIDKGVVYAEGRLALFKATHSKLPLDANLENLSNWLEQKKVKRLAIANPETAPYGQIAKQVLQRKGVWHLAEPVLVKGSNAAQAAQFSFTSADAALLPYALVILPELHEHGTHVLVSNELYRPLTHRMVLLKNAGKAAHALYQFLQSRPAKVIFAAHGFELPE